MWKCWQGGIRKGHSLSRIQAGQECEGSKKVFCRYVGKNIKENVGLVQNERNSLAAKDNLCLDLCCQGLGLVGEFEGWRYYPL